MSEFQKRLLHPLCRGCVNHLMAWVGDEDGQHFLREIGFARCHEPFFASGFLR